MRLNGELEQLQIELAEKDEVVDRSHAQIARLQEENRRMVALETDCERKAAQCAQQEKQIASLKEQVARNLVAEKEIENVEEIKNTKIRQIAEQKKELARQLEAALADLKASKDEAADLRAGMLKLGKIEQEKHTELKRQLTDLESKQGQLTSTLEDKEGALEAETKKNKQLLLQIQMLTEKLEEKEAKLRQDSDQIKKLLQHYEKQRRETPLPIKRESGALPLREITQFSERSSQLSMMSDPFTDIQELQFEMENDIQQAHFEVAGGIGISPQPSPMK